jgi:hypothetical protein
MRAKALALVLLLAASARADPTDDEAARNHFLSGTSYYDEARYEDALREFNEALRLSKRPALLFNIAACHERMSRWTEAIAALKAYLGSVPNVEDRSSIERRIATFEEKLGKEREARAELERRSEERERSAAQERERREREQAAALERERKEKERLAAELERQKSERKPDQPQSVVVIEPVVSNEPTSNVTFGGRDDDTHFAITVTSKRHVYSCVTPCELKLPRGPASVAVGRGHTTYFTRDLDVPRGAALVKVSHRCTECYVGGAVTALVGLITGGFALGFGDFNSMDQGVRIPSIVIPIGAGVITLIGAVFFISGGSNKLELTEESNL